MMRDNLCGDWLASSVNKSYKDPINRYLIACSGGMDSMVLLHLCVQAFPCDRIWVLHFDHNQSLVSAKWTDYCRKVADSYEVAFVAGTYVPDSKGTSDSLEMRLRSARYRWFSSQLKKGDVLMTAHHQNDQAETVLLRHCRGQTGVALSGIPKRRAVGTGSVVRPLLHQSQESLYDYACRYRLRWVVDQDNDNTKRERNYLRHRIIPRLEKKWLSLNHNLSRVGEQLRAQQALLDSWLEKELEAMCIEVGRLAPTRALCISLLMNHSHPKELLRHFLCHIHALMLSEKHLMQIFKQIQMGQSVNQHVGDFRICIWRSLICVVHKEAMIKRVPLEQELCAIYDGARIRLPFTPLELSVQSTKNGGLCAQYRSLRICASEHVDSAGASGLKKIWQQVNVAPWERAQWPTIIHNEKVLAVAGCGVRGVRMSARARKGHDCWRFDVQRSLCH